MASISPFQGLKFDNTLGAMLIGVLVSTTLFGLTTLQTYLYYCNYTKDRAAFKWLVASVWLLDFIHTVFISHTTYYFLVQQYGNPASLLAGEWSLIMEIVVTIGVTLLVQGFFAHRVYRLTHNNVWLSGTIVLLSLSHAATGIAAAIRLFQIHVFSRLPEVLGIMSATLILMAANDLFITAVLCLYLRKAQSSFTETQSAIQMLMVYTIETGLLTSVFVTIDAVCILVMPHNWVFIGITFCISKLYANSLLTILNSRQSLKLTDKSSNKISVLSGRQSAMGPLRMQELSSMSKSQELSAISPSTKPEQDFGALPRPSPGHVVYAV